MRDTESRRSASQPSAGSRRADGRGVPGSVELELLAEEVCLAMGFGLEGRQPTAAPATMQRR